MLSTNIHFAESATLLQFPAAHLSSIIEKCTPCAVFAALSAFLEQAKWLPWLTSQTKLDPISLKLGGEPKWHVFSELEEKAYDYNYFINVISNRIIFQTAKKIWVRGTLTSVSVFSPVLFRRARQKTWHLSKYTDKLFRKLRILLCQTGRK